MFLMDANVPVYAHREDAPEHLAYCEWLESIIKGNAAYGYSELVLSGLLRGGYPSQGIRDTVHLVQRCAFRCSNQESTSCRLFCSRAHAMDGFLQCLEQIDAKGNAVPDAYYAALAMEWNCEWVTTDKGFKRFKGLKVRHPLASMDS